MGWAKAAMPIPAGKQNSAVTRTTVSMRTRSSFRLPRAQAEVTLGKALVPKAWVMPGTSR